MMANEKEVEWERRKWYLVRSMIAHTSALSPIREEYTEALPTADVEAQAEDEGSLPDLIIERDRKRHHDDESDEYYEKFSKKIKRYYRKYFLEEDVDDDVSSYDENLGRIDYTDVNYEEDNNFTTLKERRREIYSVGEQSVSFDVLHSVGGANAESCQVDEDFNEEDNGLNNENQNNIEPDRLHDQPLVKDRLSHIARITDRSEDSSDADTYSKSRDKSNESDATLTLERVQSFKSSEEESSTSKIDYKERENSKEENQIVYRDSIDASSHEEDETETHTSHEDMSSFSHAEEEHDVSKAPHLELRNIDEMRSVQMSPPIRVMERQTSPSSGDSSAPDLNTAIHLTLESMRTTDTVMEELETPVVIDNLPRIVSMESVSQNEDVHQRLRLKRALSYPEVSTKRFKSVNLQTDELSKHVKEAVVQTVPVDFSTNVVTQTEQILNSNVATQTEDRDFQSIQTQTEETTRRNIEVQTEIGETEMIDAQIQTDDYFQEHGHRYRNYYKNDIRFNFF